MTRAQGGVWFALSVVVTLAGASGCKGQSSEEDGGSDGTGPFCTRALAKLNGCGMGALLDEGCVEPDSADERCADECILDQTCAELRALVCTGSIPPTLEACLTACQGPPFTCGSGEIVPAESRCDSYAECADGSDEAGCPAFRCTSGETVAQSSECDFFRDCADGSDEHRGCPNVFTCANGELYPDSFECDGFADCLDGSDEHAGCPTVTCADGTTTPGARCDESVDCDDGSDEPTTCPPTPREQICGTQ